jgi:hypothetical protein
VTDAVCTFAGGGALDEVTLVVLAGDGCGAMGLVLA